MSSPFLERAASEHVADNELAFAIRDGFPVSPGHTLVITRRLVAGQTVPHLHVHVIPRYRGDRPDPRGGVRWVLPEHADYWTRR